jgi:hypothetical protein
MTFGITFDIDADIVAVITTSNNSDSSDNGAISSVNLLKNDIGVEQAGALVTILKEHLTLKSLCGNKGDETELDMSGKMKGNEDAVMLTAEIVDNGALTSLNLSSNGLGKLLLPDGWSYGYHNDYSGREFYKHTDGRKANSGTPEGTTSGAIIIAAAITYMGAISSVNLLENDIGTEHAEVLASILKEHPALKSLCGNKGDETELDVSGKAMGADGAVMLAAEIVGNRAMSKFTFSGDVRDSTPVTMGTSMAEADFSGKGLGASGAIMLLAFLPKCT